MAATTGVGLTRSAAVSSTPPTTSTGRSVPGLTAAVRCPVHPGVPVPTVRPPRTLEADLTMSEGLKLAAQTFFGDVATLSCCAA